MNGFMAEAVGAHKESLGSPLPITASLDSSAISRAPELVVHCDHIAARLGTRTIWRDVTLRIHAGEFVAVVGPNGAGKSTLLRALLGLVPLAEGRVMVLGRRVRRGNRAVSYLPQRRVFDADVRIRGRDLVRLGLDGTRWGVPLPGLRTCLRQGDAVRGERRRI